MRGISLDRPGHSGFSTATTPRSYLYYALSTQHSAFRFTFYALLLALTALGALTAASALASHPADVIYVDDSAMGANNGSSWPDAYESLQDGLAHANSGDEIWVAAGIYTPGANRSDTFQLENGVEVYGGFAGGETQREQRDWEANRTVLSGDIDDNDGTDASGVVTDTANIVGANSYHVVTGSDTDASAVMDGFTITAGQANGDLPDDSGAGMYTISGSSTLANLTFSGNQASLSGGGDGGGMYNHSNSSPALTTVTFIGNTASDRGGGMANYYGSSPT
ncbi:MAG TPA: hypothetical protein VEQ85_05025, partial [Lacipirellulaceae bacterium]|nr:hypothetical protein [Lacipirellulaceae bacterium]